MNPTIQIERRAKRIKIRMNDVEVEIESDIDKLDDIIKKAESVARKIHIKDHFTSEYIG